MDGLSTNGNSISMSSSDGAASMAQAMLPAALKSVGLSNATVTMAVNPVAMTSVSLNPSLFSSLSTSSGSTATPVILTDVTHLSSEKEDHSAGTGSDISTASSCLDEKATRKISVPQKRGEVYV